MNSHKRKSSGGNKAKAKLSRSSTEPYDHSKEDISVYMLRQQNKQMATALFDFRRQIQTLEAENETMKKRHQDFDTLTSVVNRHWTQLDDDLGLILARLDPNYSHSVLKASGDSSEPSTLIDKLIQASGERPTTDVHMHDADVSEGDEGDDGDADEGDSNSRRFATRSIDKALAARCKFTKSVLQAVVTHVQSAVAGGGSAVADGDGSFTALHTAHRESAAEVLLLRDQLVQAHARCAELQDEASKGAISRHRAQRALDRLRVSVGRNAGVPGEENGDLDTEGEEAAATAAATDGGVKTEGGRNVKQEASGEGAGGRSGGAGRGSGEGGSSSSNGGVDSLSEGDAARLRAALAAAEAADVLAQSRLVEVEQLREAKVKATVEYNQLRTMPLSDEMVMKSRVYAELLHNFQRERDLRLRAVQERDTAGREVVSVRQLLQQQQRAAVTKEEWSRRRWEAAVTAAMQESAGRQAAVDKAERALLGAEEKARRAEGETKQSGELKVLLQSLEIQLANAKKEAVRREERAKQMEQETARVVLERTQRKLDRATARQDEAERQLRTRGGEGGGAEDARSLQARLVEAEGAEQRALDRLTEAQTAASNSTAEADGLIAEIESMAKALDDMQEQHKRLMSAVRQAETARDASVSREDAARRALEAAAEERRVLRVRAEQSDGVAQLQGQLVGKSKARERQLLERLAEGERRAAAAQRLADDARQAASEATKAAQRHSQHAEQLKGTVSELSRRLEEASRGQETSIHAARRSEEEATAARKQLQTAQRDLDRVKQELAGVSAAAALAEEERSGAGGTGAEAERDRVEEDMLREEELKQLKQQLKCSVCRDRQKNCVIAKCFHVFCRHCVQRNLEVRSRKCPACGKGFGQDDVRDLWLT